jgi:hypothetical protein
MGLTQKTKARANGDRYSAYYLKLGLFQSGIAEEMKWKRVGELHEWDSNCLAIMS